MTETLGPYRMPTTWRQYSQLENNKGHNAANMNLIKMNNAFMKIQPTNMNRSGITLFSLWECLLSMKGE